jgi:hypothetical protein
MVVGLVIGGGLIFNLFSFFGERMLKSYEEEEKANVRAAAEADMQCHTNVAVID